MPVNELSGELSAMASVERALASLELDVQARVLRWACERFNVEARGGASSEAPQAKAEKNAPSTPASESDADFGTLAEFYDAASPETDADKVLVASYWFQYREGHQEIEARRINTELKHLGYGVGNVTRAFENLKAARPALIVQTRKDGSTRQAQKKFKVTHEGRKAVDRMVTGSAG